MKLTIDGLNEHLRAEKMAQQDKLMWLLVCVSLCVRACMRAYELRA